MNPIQGWLADARQNPDTRHVDTCDGVRALAILIVAWYHIWQQSWLYPNLTIGGKTVSFDPLVRSGYIWVDIMILISGFCLYLPWARLTVGEAGQSPLAFYEKRLARVHPSYLLTIAVMFGVALATNAYGANRAFLLRDLVSHLTYTQMFAYDTYYATNLGGALWDAGVGNAALSALSAAGTRVQTAGRADVCGDGRACAGVEKVYCGGV